MRQLDSRRERVKSLTISEIKTKRQFYEMKSSWDQALNKSLENNIFLTWEKMAPSVNFLEKESSLKILCATECNEIVGIAPFRITQRRLMGLFNLRIIEPLTNGETDYTGLIITEKANQCLKAFLTYLFSQKDWDFLCLPDIPQASQTFCLMKNSKGIPNFVTEKGYICPYVAVPESKEKLLASIDPKLRKKLRKSLRKLESEQGKVELKHYREIGSLERAMEILVKLHQKRWNNKGTPGRFANEKSLRITLQTAKYFAEKDWLRLYFLTVKDKVVAVELNLEYGKKMYCHIKGFDPEYYKYRVGSLLTWKVLEECVEKGIVEYDLMQGDESYKYEWTHKQRQNITVRWVNKKLTSNLVDSSLKVLSAAKISSLIIKYANILFLLKGAIAKNPPYVNGFNPILYDYKISMPGLKNNLP